MNANTNSASPSEPPGSESNQVIDPVNWEARYRSGDTPWDEGYAAPGLTEFLAHHPICGEILVPGSGPGHDVRALAAQGNRARVLGLDLSPTAVRLAESFPSTGTETYEVDDLFDLPESWNQRFDWVVEHTCFCAIPPEARADYVRAIERVLKPGGHYFAIFYLNPAAPQGPPHGITREEIERLFQPGFRLLEEWVPSGAFEGREGRELCQVREKVDRPKTEGC
jgi:SAM-dependent methyltransferase